MAREFFKRFVPSAQRVQTDRRLRLLRPLLNKPYLWHLRRHAVARGFAIGAFWSMWPVAGQTIPALIIAVRLRSNVAIAFAALWLSNPFLLVPHWWSAYLIGRFLLRTPPSDVHFTWEYLSPRLSSPRAFASFVWENFHSLYVPVFVGSLIEGVVLASLGYVLIMYLWKRHSIKRWRLSRKRAAGQPRRTEPELATV